MIKQKEIKESQCDHCLETEKTSTRKPFNIYRITVNFDHAGKLEEFTKDFCGRCWVENNRLFYTGDKTVIMRDGGSVSKV